ncbi:uracil-DNA glycosylase family protein [Burkholderia pseudomallei]|uniref:uracil-DNA glycosylase family protein n=1 Tax=Burkholderia pseudomallei TaxID=28450 RepID=UPI0005BB5ECD|nr:uracil-DNA glycosylase family protein [Burkholderia pseudomallei]
MSPKRNAPSPVRNSAPSKPTRHARLDALLREIRACSVCAPHLPCGPRPVVRAHPGARILIVGQAPGARVHASGIPWDDASGKRLRAWLNVDDATFYDESLFAIVPMGFCYPGRGASGDNPPRPECAPLWLDKLLAELPDIRLTLLIGQYAQRRFLGTRRKSTLTETVRAWPEYAPEFIPLPHPSPRNQGWLKQHPWFDADVLPALRDRVAELLPTPPGSRRTKR